MNLSKLFEMQSVLDDRIYDRFPDLRGKDNLDWKILALQVELGECANEWSGFKKWSKDQVPRTQVDVTTNSHSNFDYFQCFECGTVANKDLGIKDHDEVYVDCPLCDRDMHKMKSNNPLLEEYVDCMHFILSIGNSCKFYDGEFYTSHKKDALEQFKYTFQKASDLGRCRSLGNYEMLMCSFLALGDFLGFTPEQIEHAYYAKNRINHNRQETGY